MKKKLFLYLLLGIIIIIATVIYIVQFLNDDSNNDNPEIIEKEVSFNQAIQLTEEYTDLPISLPTNVPFQMKENTAYVNFYEYSENEELNEVEFNYSNKNEDMKLIISNIEVQREEGDLESFGVEGLKANYIENDDSQVIWWEFEEGIFYTLLFNSERRILNQDEMSTLMTQIILGGQDE